MTTKTNKILGAVVAIAIICSIVVLVYVNLPKPPGSPSGNNNDHTSSTVLTLVYGDQQKNFTLANIAALGSYTARGGYRTNSSFIKGVGNYTGVNISTLVNTLNPAPLSYSLKIFSEDGSNTIYNYTTIGGKVDFYNPKNASDPTPIGKGIMTMVLAYEFEGQPLNDGTLKIAFLDGNGSITKASLWWKNVISMRIITE